MTRLSTRLLLLLALLGALWHPLCACTGTWTASEPRTESASCCESSAPSTSSDPCGKPAGECECERELTLASTEGDGGATFRVPLFALAPCVGVLPIEPRFVVRPRPTARAVPPRPPDRCRPVPLRI